MGYCVLCFIYFQGGNRMTCNKCTLPEESSQCSLCQGRKPYGPFAFCNDCRMRTAIHHCSLCQARFEYPRGYTPPFTTCTERCRSQTEFIESQLAEMRREITEDVRAMLCDLLQLEK